MKRMALVGLLFLALPAVAFSGIRDAIDDAREDARTFVAHLDGKNEVPERITKAHGKATFKLSDNGTTIRYRIVVNNIDNVVMAHLHQGDKATNGPIVVTLVGPMSPSGIINGMLKKGKFTAADLQGPMAGKTLKDLMKEMRRGDLYVNVHTDDGVAQVNSGAGDFSDGEIRGQVRP